MKRNQHGALAATVGLLLALGACSSTRMTNSWKAADVAARPSLSRVAVIAMAYDRSVREMAEEDVASRIGSKVTPSYRVLAGMDVTDRAAVEDWLSRQGFDGLLIIQIAGVSERRVDWPSGTFINAHDWYSPASRSTNVETTVRVVSRLYSLRDRRMLWSGSTRTNDADSVQKMVDGMSRAVAKELHKNRLI
jgi:hypothetical protein